MNRRTRDGAPQASPVAEPSASRPAAILWPGIAVLAGVLTALLAASWTGPGAATAFPAAIAELLHSAPAAVGWLAMAFGFGWPVRRLLAPRDGDGARFGAVLQIAGGVAVALALDAFLGTWGMLGSRSAWLLLAAGAVLAGASLTFDRPRCHPLSPIGLAAAPAAAILLLASTSAPGWLWGSEFGGYDALSYHLQLPKEWLLAGRIEPAPHCVYGYFPSFVESAFLHLMALRGGDADAALDAATSCQLLHAGLAMLAAWASGEAAAAWAAPDERGSPTAGGVAAAIVMVTPWVVVVGSLAYNEMATLLMLAGAMALVGPQAPREVASAAAARRGIAVGLLATAAVGAKLTALGFVALPAALLLLWSLPPRRWVAACATGGVVALVLLAPWLARNASATGNPLFPFAASTLGLGTGEFGWSAEQADRFARGHASDLSFAARLSRLGEQLPFYGFGSNPRAGEPWRPQWSIVPLLGAAALLALLSRPRCRPAGARLAVVLAAQLSFWLAATHLQSRFLLPAAVPLAMACGLAAASLLRQPTEQGQAVDLWRASERFRGARLLLLGVLAALSLGPAILYRGERNGMPSAAIGAAPLMRGEATSDGNAQASSESPAHWMNAALPAGSRVLLVGESRPFWFRGAPASYVWQTTWDRSVVSRVLRDHPDDPAAQRGALRAEGFTHLLIDPAMLQRWEHSGWNDPRVTSAALRPMLEPPNQVLKRFAGGAVLILLGPP